MFEKRKCSQCEKCYDAALARCPDCRTTNELQPKELKHNTVVTFWKQILLFAIGWAGIKIIVFFIELFACISNGIDFSNAELVKEFTNQPNISMLINGLTYALTLIALLLALFNEIPSLFPSFKKWQPYVAAFVSVVVIIYASNLYSLLLSALDVQIKTNGNQGSINNISEAFPAISIIVFAFIGPVCEELTYRVGLFTTLRRINKYIAYPITILFFALIHFSFSSDTEILLNELINLPYYLIGGIVLTFVYDKFGLAASVTAHIAYNVITFLPFTAVLFRVIC